MHRMYQSEISRPTNQTRSKEQLELLGSPIVKKLMEKKGLDEEFILDHALQIQSWLSRRKQCRYCNGLKFCSQPIRGNLKTISVEDGELNETWELCRYALEQQNQLHHRERFLYSNLTTDQYLLEFDRQNLTKNLTRACVEAYLTLYHRFNSKKGMYFYGKPGVGKTYLMAEFAASQARRNKTVSFAKCPLLIQDIRNNMDSREYRARIMRALTDCDILILDDIGSEYISQWTRDEILFPILDTRMERNLPTFFTSNQSIDTLLEVYTLNNQSDGEMAARRFIDRIRALSDEYLIAGESLRY